MSSTQYGIRVTNNRFALFDDVEDDDPLEMIKKREQELLEKKKNKLAEKENKQKEVKKPAVTASKTPRKVKPAEKKEESPKEVRKSEENWDTPKTETGTFNDDEKSYFNGGENDVKRGGGGGRGARGFAPRGGGGGGGGRGRGAKQDNRGKREYDRQSGSDRTGVKPVDKKEGYGSRNWGGVKDDLIEETPQPQEETEEVVTQDVIMPVVDEPVVEQKELTLDEWKALKGPRQKPTYNLRKAGEGEDLTQWKKMYALQKKKEGEHDDEEEYEYDLSEYPQRVGRLKHLLDIDIHFKDARSGRGRAGRGGRKFNQDRNHGSEPKIAPKVDDEHDFPSLG